MMINSTGEIISKTFYDDIGTELDELDRISYPICFRNGLAAVMLNKKWGYINTSSEMIIPPIYETAFPFKEGLARVVSGNKKMGFIDKLNQIIILFKYDAVFSFQEGLAIATYNMRGKSGFIDKGNNIIIDFKYSIVYEFYNGLAMVSKNPLSYKGYIDKEGNEYWED